MHTEELLRQRLQSARTKLNWAIQQVLKINKSRKRMQSELQDNHLLENVQRFLNILLKHLNDFIRKQAYLLSIYENALLEL